MADEPSAGRNEPPSHEREVRAGGPAWSWPEIRRGTPLRVLIDFVQYGVAMVLLVLAAVVLVRSFIGFITSVNAPSADYTTALISAVDGVLVVIILVDIMRTVLTHLEGWGFPFRPFLVIGIIAAVPGHPRRLDPAHPFLRCNPSTRRPHAVAVGARTNAGVILVLAVALFLTRGQNVDAESDSRQ